ncbi:cytochrome P460 family protein [Desulfogranum japonicum]|uniref:cytochrome P460 family protein n=1 Tax=Desulfogranum japonicum TaxID=231447 RepID=UPI000426B1C1|nr:cytochrome P460 family protein [Desulfogranum japonicum]
MKFKLSFLVSLIMVGLASVATGTEITSSHNIDYPTGWQNWSSIAVSHRTDNNTLRIILGNKTAVDAARVGQTNPWPDGAMLGKVVWKDIQLENWEEATVPGQFVHVEFMIKDSKKYSNTYGWGWARWVGPDLKPFNKGAQTCISCHTPVQNRDWVFTDPAPFPTIE